MDFLRLYSYVKKIDTKNSSRAKFGDFGQLKRPNLCRKADIHYNFKAFNNFDYAILHSYVTLFPSVETMLKSCPKAALPLALMNEEKFCLVASRRS